MKKLYVVAFSLGLFAVGVALATIQSFKVSGTEVYSLSDAGALTLGGGVTASGIVTGTKLAFSGTTDITTVAPGSVGQLVLAASPAGTLYIGTGTASTAQWVKVGAQ